MAQSSRPAAVAGSVNPCAIQKKVTLTNWKRLANTAFQFDTQAQAFFWRDYVVVFVYNCAPGALHIYHLRQDIWSQITATVSRPTGSGYQHMPVTGHAYVVHNGELIFLAMAGNVFKFSTADSHRWCECPEMKLPVSNPSSSIYTILATASLFGDTHNSLVVLEAQSESIDSLCTLRYLQGSEANPQWSHPCKLQKSIYCYSRQDRQKYHTTFAAMQGYLFVSNGFETFCLNVTSRSADIIPVSEVA